MNIRNMPGFTAQVSLYRSSQQYRMGLPEGPQGGPAISPQMRASGDSENLLVCLGACLCCGLCKEGPWQRASCQLCNRCVATTTTALA
jgi:hypothetical protein